MLEENNNHNQVSVDLVKRSSEETYKSNEITLKSNQTLFFFLWEGKNHENQQAQPT